MNNIDHVDWFACWCRFERDGWEWFTMHFENQRTQERGKKRSTRQSVQISSRSSAPLTMLFSEYLLFDKKNRRTRKNEKKTSERTREKKEERIAIQTRCMIIIDGDGGGGGFKLLRLCFIVFVDIWKNFFHNFYFEINFLDFFLGHSTHLIDIDAE